MSRRRGPDPAKWLPLAPLTTEVLMALGAGKCHGSAIVEDIRARTNRGFHFTIGTVYSVLHRLDVDQLIVEIAPCGGGGRRQGVYRCYELSPLGREVMQLEVDRMQRALDTARRGGFGDGPEDQR